MDATLISWSLWDLEGHLVIRLETNEAAVETMIFFPVPKGLITIKSPISIMWGPQTIAKLVHIIPITMVYGTYNELVTGAYKPTNITGGGIL